MRNHLNREVQAEDRTFRESESSRLHKESLLNAVAELHSAFSEHRALDMSNLFNEDAILMFPNTQDIVGRESIRAAFAEFMTMYRTKSFDTKQDFLDVGEQRATSLVKFLEIRTPTEGGPTEKVYGRLLEIWELSSEGKWEIIRMMTGRFSETEFLQ